VESVSAIHKAAASLPTPREILSMWGPLTRSFVIGTVIGAIPGAGATVAAFVSYGVEKQYTKKGALLGTGVMEGVAAPNCAANAATGGAMIPLLVLGIPGGAAPAVMLGAFLLHGIQPGPQIFTTNTEMVYTIFAAQYTANILMLIGGLLAVPIFVKVLKLPEAICATFILVFCFIGSYALRNSMSDVWIMAGAGIIGYFMRKFNYPIAPLVLGTILGPLAESAFITSMISYRNDWTIFFTRPVCAVVMALCIIAVLIPIWKSISDRMAANKKPVGP
jgi:putative tricarboxylic transport membrane protein